MCALFPYLFHAYGPRVRGHGKYAAESARAMESLDNKPIKPQETIEGESTEKDEKIV